MDDLSGQEDYGSQARLSRSDASWNGDQSHFSGAGRVDGPGDRRRRGAEASQVIGREHDHPDAPSGEILLIRKILVGREKEVEFGFGRCEESPVSLSGPPPLPDGRACVAAKSVVDRPRNALVEQDPHAGGTDNSAARDVSRTRRASSRETEGKHSRNSSSV